MNRKEKCEEERHNAWERANNVQERIKELKKVASEYPEFMTPLSDIAVSYLKTGDTVKCVKIYQEIINKKNTFQHIWANDLGKAYLFVKDYGNAIEILEKSNVISYDQGLFLALAHLKNGDKKTAKKQFEKWVSEDLEKSFRRHDYEMFLSSLLDDDEKNFITEMWNKYYNKYVHMEPYELYCKLYKQHYQKYFTENPYEGDDEDFEDDNFEIPSKLNRVKFEEAKDEYLYLDRQATFGDLDDSEYEKYFELRDLLFADVMF
jgi:hypothetical protein